MEENKIIHKIAIVGGGPKGMYGFERLSAWLKMYPPSEIIEIHIFNSSNSFGAGENYRAEQPSYLLMNNPIGEINIWGDVEPASVVPLPLSFLEWIRLSDDANISSYSYTTRALTGRYLSDGFKLIASNLPENVIGKYIIGEVVDIYNDSGKYLISLKTAGDEIHQNLSDRYDHILISTGHPKQRKSKQALLCNLFAIEHEKAGFIPFIYPIETAFSDVAPNTSIGIKGIGLTFVDAVLGLTEGKGGQFKRDKKSEKLIYIPSGNEPKVIYPFSRSGLPMIPRLTVSNANNELKYFTRSAIQEFKSGRKIDFEQHIWPLLKQDMLYAYYNITLKNDGYSSGLSDFDNFEDVKRMVAKYHKEFPSEITFDVDYFMNPLQETTIYRDKTHHHYIKALSKYYLQEARKGELESPMAAVTAVWRKATSLFCEIYSFGGLTPESQRFFDSSVRGKLNRITYGPPIKNAEKIYALIDSGILNFEAARSPDLILDDTSGTFILHSKSNNFRYPINYLIDARMPNVSLLDDPSPLFRNLLNRGMISVYENKFEKESYQPGAINVTNQGFVIDKNGRANRNIVVTGTPTEGITFDNDTLSRDRNNFVDKWAEYISIEYAKSKFELYAT